MCDDIMMMNEWMDDACDDANECIVMVNIRFTYVCASLPLFACLG